RRGGGRVRRRGTPGRRRLHPGRPPRCRSGSRPGSRGTGAGSVIQAGTERSQAGAVNGMLVIAKPTGITSHDVVARVRRILRTRQGEVIERAARRVEIYRLEITRFDPGPEPGAALRVTCSSGTYVRTLCHDLGERLGTGAVMTGLTRTAIGPFTLAGAITLEA